MTRVGQAHIELEASTKRAQAKITAFVQETRKQLEGLASLNVGAGRASGGASENAAAARAQLEAQRLAAAAARTATAELQQQTAAARLAAAEQQKLAAQARAAATGQTAAAQQAAAATRQQIADARLLTAQQQQAAAAARATAQQQAAAARAAAAQLSLQGAQQRAAAQQAAAQARQQEQAAAAVVQALQNQQQASVAAYNMGRTSLQQMLAEQRALQQQALQTAQTYGQQTTAYRQLTATAQAAQRAMDQSRTRAGNDQIAQLRTQLSALRAEYERAVGAAGRFNQAGQNQAARTYATQLAALRTQIQAVGQQSGLTAQQMTALNNMTAQVSAQTNALNGAFSRVGLGGNLMNVLRTLPQFAAQAGGSLGAASAQAMGFAQTAASLGTSLGPVGIAIGAVTAALTAFAGAAIAGAQAAVQFEAGMAKVSTLMDQQPAQLGAVANGILDISKRTGATAQDLQNGLYDIMGAAVQGTESQAAALAFLEQSTRLAIAGMTNTATATDVMTSVMNAYKLSATDAGMVSDKLFKAVDMGKMSFEQLAQSLGMVTAVASSAGVSLDETLAALATMTANGVNASSAVDYLRSLISSILKPSEQAAKLSEALGIEFGESALRAKGLTGVLRDVIAATGGSTSEMAVLFGGVEALTAATSIATGEFGRMEGSLQGMANAAGTTDEAYEKVASTTQKALDRLKASFEALKIELGAGMLPGIDGAIDGLTRMTDWLAQLAAQARQAGSDMVSQFQPYLDSIAPIVDNLVGAVVPMLQGMYEVVKGILYDLGLFFGATFKGLWPVLQPLLEALTALIKTGFETIGNILKAVGLAMQGDWKGSWDAITQINQEKLDGLIKVMHDTEDRFAEAGSNLGSAILNGFEGSASSFFSMVADMLAATLEWVKQYAPFWAQGIVGALAGGLRGAAASLMGNAEGAFGRAGEAWGGLSTAFGGADLGDISNTARAIVDQAFQKRGDNLADNVVDYCARWVRDTLGDAMPAARAQIDRLFQSNPGPGGVPTATSAANNFKRAGLARAYTGVKDLKPGDTIFYTLNGQNHVGTYVGDGMVRGNNRVSNRENGRPVGSVAINSLGTPNYVVRADDLARFLSIGGGTAGGPRVQGGGPNGGTTFAAAGAVDPYAKPAGSGGNNRPATPAAPKSFESYIKEAQRIQAAIDKYQSQGAAGAENWRLATAELERFRESSPLAAQAIQWLSTQQKAGAKTTSQYGQTFDRLSEQLKITDSLSRLGESADSVKKKLVGIRDEARTAANNEKARYGETEKYLKLLDLAADAQGKIDALNKPGGRRSGTVKPEDVGLTTAQWEKHGTKALQYVTKLHELEKTGTDAQILAQRNLLDAYKAQSSTHAKALEYAEEVYKRRNTNSSGKPKKPQDAGLTVEQWNKYGQKAMQLVRDVNAAREKGDTNGLIAAQRQLNLFRQQSTVHENAASFAEAEVARLDKVKKDQEESQKEATKTQQELDKQLAQGRVDLAEQSLKKLEAQRERDLRNAGDDAAARLHIEQTLGKQILESRKRVAEKVRDAALAEASKLTNEDLKKQRKDKANTDYDLAVDAAQDEYNERVANAQKVRDKAAKTSSELRLGIARALTDAEVDLAEQAANGVIAQYQNELKAAGDNAQAKARLEVEWSERVQDARVALEEAASKRRVLALQRERNRLMHQEGVMADERRAIWGKYADLIKGEEAALQTRLAGLLAESQQTVDKALEAATEQVIEANKQFQSLTDRVNEASQAGQFNARAQAEVTKALEELDMVIGAAGLTELTADARAAAVAAIEAAAALYDWTSAMREAGAAGDEMRLGVLGGSQTQDLLLNARQQISDVSSGAGYDMVGLEESAVQLSDLLYRIEHFDPAGTDEFVRDLLAKVPEAEDTVRGLLKALTETRTTLDQRNAAAVNNGEIARLNRQLAQVDRQQQRGEIGTLAALEQRRDLQLKVAELEYQNLINSDQYLKAIPQEQQNMRDEAVAGWRKIWTGFQDDVDDFNRSEARLLEDGVANSQLAQLEANHEAGLISTREYHDRLAELQADAAWTAYNRAIQDGKSLTEAQNALQAELNRIANEGAKNRLELNDGLIAAQGAQDELDKLLDSFADGTIALPEFNTQIVAAANNYRLLADQARLAGNLDAAAWFQQLADVAAASIPPLADVVRLMRELNTNALVQQNDTTHTSWLAGLTTTKAYAEELGGQLKTLSDQYLDLFNKGDTEGMDRVQRAIQTLLSQTPELVRTATTTQLLADFTAELTKAEQELGIAAEDTKEPLMVAYEGLNALVMSGAITAEEMAELEKRLYAVVEAGNNLKEAKKWAGYLQDAAGLFNRNTPVGGGLAAALDGLAAWFGAGGRGGGSKAVLSGAAALVGGLKGVFKTGSEEADQVVNTFVSGIQATLMKLATGDWVGAAVAGVATVVATIVDIFQGGAASAKKAKQEIEQATSGVKIFKMDKYASVQRKKGFWGWLGFKEAVIDKESVGIAQTLGDAISSAVSGGIMNGLRQGQSSFKVVGEAISADFGAALMQTIIDTFIQSVVVQELLQPYLDAYVDAVKRKDAAGIQKAGADMQRAIVDANGVIADAYENVFVPAAKELGVFGKDTNGGQVGAGQQELFGTGPDALYGVPTIETTPSPEAKALISQAAQVVADLGGAVSEWRAGTAEFRAFISGQTGKPPAMTGYGGLT